MAAAAVLCGSKRSFLFEEDHAYPSSIHRSKRLRCSSSSTVPPHQHVTPLRRPAEDTEPERFVKRAKMTHHESLSAEEWVEVFVREMSSATSVDDAKSRAAKALHDFETRAAAEAEKKEEENSQNTMVLKQEMEDMKNENVSLKRRVINQNELLKELEGRNQELEYMKQLENQYKERVSKLKVANYVLELHLKQAQCNNSIPLGFHPHVF